MRSAEYKQFNRDALRYITGSLAIVCLAVLAFGCAEKGPILLDLRYQAPEGSVPSARKPVVGISPFKDDRGKTTSVLGLRITSSDITNDYVAQGTAADAVAARLRDALRARGIIVKEAPQWNLTPEGITAEGVDLVLGGEIKKLWVESTSKVLDTTIVAEAHLRVVAADAKEKRLLRTLTLKSKQERTDFSFALANVEDTLSSVLSAAIEQLFVDEEMNKSLR